VRIYRAAWFCFWATGSAWAQDNSFHQLNGDLAFDGSAGLASSNTVAPYLQARLMYVGTVGVYGNTILTNHYQSAWSVGTGLELRPLLLPRLLTNQEQGPAVLDLVIDSLSLRTGTRFFAQESLPALELGSSLELPFFATFNGPFLGVTTSVIFSQATLATPARGEVSPWFLLQLTLGWRWLIHAHIVDASDRRTPLHLGI